MLMVEPDLEWVFIDRSIFKAHQHSSGAANTTNIHIAVDAWGLPIGFSVTGVEVHDGKEAPEPVAKLPVPEYMVANKGYAAGLPGFKF